MLQENTKITIHTVDSGHLKRSSRTFLLLKSRRIKVNEDSNLKSLFYSTFIVMYM